MPSISYEKQVKHPSGQEIAINDTVLCKVLFGGDQLTVARARSSIAVGANHPTQQGKL